MHWKRRFWANSLRNGAGGWNKIEGGRKMSNSSNPTKVSLDTLTIHQLYTNLKEKSLPTVSETDETINEMFKKVYETYHATDKTAPTLDDFEKNYNTYTANKQGALTLPDFKKTIMLLKEDERSELISVILGILKNQKGGRRRTRHQRSKRSNCSRRHRK